MRTDPVLQSIAELLAYIYDELILCPLPEERELLLHAGNETEEDFFSVCRMIFGENMQKAFHKICVYVANYCDSLIDNFDGLLKESDAGVKLILPGNKLRWSNILQNTPPIDSIEEKAILHSLAYQARLCHNHLRKNYCAYLQQQRVACPRKPSGI